MLGPCGMTRPAAWVRVAEYLSDSCRSRHFCYASQDNGPTLLPCGGPLSVPIVLSLQHRPVVHVMLGLFLQH